MTFNLGQTWICEGLPTSIRSHLVFVYYPTLILTWTAMGLFFGVFLEGFLNGRRLRDDVIDIELNLVTNGKITGDGVGRHSDYLSRFPYLGKPHV